MYLNHKYILIVCLEILLSGCSAGFSLQQDRSEYVQARSAYEEGNYQQAISLLSSYIYKTQNEARREARSYRLLGLSYERLGQTDRAMEVYSEALEFHPEYVPLLLEAARLYQENGLITRSIELYERALAEEPLNAQALTGQAANYARLGFYSKARTFYDKFFELTPTVSPYYLALYASTFLQQRNYEQAFIHITQALEQENTNPDFWRLSAEARRGLNMNKEALLDLQTAIMLAPERSDFLAYKALWLYEAGAYDSSLQTAEQILHKSPDNNLALFVQALNWQKQGNQTRARAQLTQIAKATPLSFIGQVAQKMLSTSTTR